MYLLLLFHFTPSSSISSKRSPPNSSRPSAVRTTPILPLGWLSLRASMQTNSTTPSSPRASSCAIQRRRLTFPPRKKHRSRSSRRARRNVSCSHPFHRVRHVDTAERNRKKETTNPLHFSHSSLTGEITSSGLPTRSNQHSRNTFVFSLVLHFASEIRSYQVDLLPSLGTNRNHLYKLLINHLPRQNVVVEQFTLNILLFVLC